MIMDLNQPKKDFNRSKSKRSATLKDTINVALPPRWEDDRQSKKGTPNRCTVTFSRHEGAKLDTPHDDALVIASELAGVTFSRILVDTGSAANVQEKPSFITESSTYCYRVIPSGLKNAGATYQRLVNKMFSKLLCKTMEVYIEDMLFKSSVANAHFIQLQECFNILNKFGMKLNPTKCTFGVASREFLGYLVTKRGIGANPKHFSIDTSPARSIKEVQRLTGKPQR